jgi:hypothetical protein
MALETKGGETLAALPCQNVQTPVAQLPPPMQVSAFFGVQTSRPV